MNAGVPAFDQRPQAGLDDRRSPWTAPAQTTDALPDEPAWGSALTTPCPQCDASWPPDAHDCPNCGIALYEEVSPARSPGVLQQPITQRHPSEPPCRSCGATIATDGYCEVCGERALSHRDHLVHSVSHWVAGVCDRGLRHHRNEDAMALASTPDAGQWAALVVCDGVSTAMDSDAASMAAATAGAATLREAGPDGYAPIVGAPSARAAAWSAQLNLAAQRANDAILASSSRSARHDANPPSCTFVAAVIDGPVVVTGWLGDSRAYWIPDDGVGEQLSVDDSWAQEMVSQGMSQATAENSPQAHAITRWLGPDATDIETRTCARFLTRPGWVFVCSDGLWNYCSGPIEFSRLVQRCRESVGDDPEALCRALVAWANEQGGRDNITVAAARIAATDGTENTAVRTVPSTDSEESHG